MTPITFPNLGLTFQIDPVAFSIGGFSVYWYGVIIGLGFVLAVLYCLRRSKEFGVTQDDLSLLLVCMILAGLVGARLYYCLFNFSVYRSDPRGLVSMLYVHEGGLAIYGGILGGVIAAAICCRVKKLRLLPVLDLCTGGVLIGQIIGRWGNFVNQEAYGAVTDSFFKMGLVNGAGEVVYYHPTFLYESCWNLIGFFLLYAASKHRKYDGQMLLLYMGWYGLGRFFIEGLRTDSLYLGGTGIRVSQALSLVILIVAVVLLVINRFFRKPKPAARG